MAENRVTQVTTDVVVKPVAPEAHVTQAVVEAIYTKHPPGDVSQFVVEAITHTTVPGDVSQFVLEIVRPFVPLATPQLSIAFLDG